ncbi:MAG: LysM peptidoglycan-binding domain-containing protein [Geobacter sp.]|jgi:membrane-bound lytic murein transglycosylase D|nr:LysM peptidoglycan-binding domain-containing protein [Geobacter sp.]
MRILMTGIAAALTMAGAAAAAEPTQALLNELVQPHTTASRINKQAEARREMPSALFTLEELHENGSELPGDLDLPDDVQADDIPLAINDQVNYFINYFQTKGRNTYAHWLTRSTRYLPMMKEILRKEGLPDELVYVAMIESGFQLHARSWANAVGPWQFMSATGRRYSLRIDQWVDERKDPVKATMAAAMYLKDLYGMFNNDWYLAAAGYNAGENKIFRAISKYDTDDFWEISKGSYLKRETKEYVPKLLAAAIIAKDPAKYGFTEITAVPAVEFDTVTVSGRTDLELVARLTGTTYQTIKELNPALRHWCTPPNYPDYELKIPKGSADRFQQGIAAIPDEQRFSEKKLYSRYKAGRRDTLKVVAKRFGITAGELADLNSIGRKTKIAGKTLVVPARHTVDFAHEGSRKPVVATRRSTPETPVIQYYTVQKGDTLYGLARRFKVSTKLLTAWNNLKNTVTLIPGKRLIIAKHTTVSRNG